MKGKFASRRHPTCEQAPRGEMEISVRTTRAVCRGQATAQRAGWKASIPECRMCGQAPESISHLISECSELAGDEYKIQHDKAGRAVLRERGYGHNQHHHTITPGQVN